MTDNVARLHTQASQAVERQLDNNGAGAHSGGMPPDDRFTKLEGAVAGLDGRVGKLESAIEKLQVGIDALRHNQTIFLTSIIFVMTATLAVAGYFSTTALSEIRAIGQRMDRFLERPAPQSPAPQIIIIPAPQPAPTK